MKGTKALVFPLIIPMRNDGNMNAKERTWCYKGETQYKMHSDAQRKLVLVVKSTLTEFLVVQRINKNLHMSQCNIERELTFFEEWGTLGAGVAAEEQCLEAPRGLEVVLLNRNSLKYFADALAAILIWKNADKEMPQAIN